MARLTNFISDAHRSETVRAFWLRLGSSHAIGAENVCDQNPHCDTCRGHRPARVRFRYRRECSVRRCGHRVARVVQLDQLDPWRGAVHLDPGPGGGAARHRNLPRRASRRDRALRRRAVHAQLPFPRIRWRQLHGTAGHCILGTSRSAATSARCRGSGHGAGARDADGNPIGEFAYAILQDPKDFSLIRLDPFVQADAGMCHFGGPTAINDDRPGLTERWCSTGSATAWGGRCAPGPQRRGGGHAQSGPRVRSGRCGSRRFGKRSHLERRPGSRSVGDGGVHTASVGSGGLDAGLIGMTRLTPQVERAKQVLGVDLVLQLAPTQ